MLLIATSDSLMLKMVFISKTVHRNAIMQILSFDLLFSLRNTLYTNIDTSFGCSLRWYPPPPPPL